LIRIKASLSPFAFFGGLETRRGAGGRSMSYRDMLVVLDPVADSRGRCELAAALAERFAAHLVGLYPVPRPELGSLGANFDAAFLEPLYREWRETAFGQAEACRQAFDRAAQLRGLSAEWRGAADGSEADPVLHARYADLTILGQLDPTDETMALTRPRPERVALACGRPILVIPYAGHFETIGRHALVAWDDSREATRALADAMPLLAAAETVSVLVIDPQEGPAAHGAVPGADISLHLARHGVKPAVERTVSAGVPPGEVLLSRAADLGADLLVMGAYGHSRARELLLGGVTRTILRSMTLPVLMSH
jgi:nucleotide-binding universal stress UspA family protein